MLSIFRRLMKNEHGATAIEYTLIAALIAVAAIDAGVVLSGIEARADARPVAHTAGLMLGVRAGVLYAF